MDIFVSIISVCIACAFAVGVMILLLFLESRFQIKEYNKRHKGKFDENTNPWVMSKRYRDWYIENFANKKG